jgi:hypothetical protein
MLKEKVVKSKNCTVNVQLEQLVGLVDRDLDLRSEFEDAVVVGRVRVDHDRVSVAVDDFKVHLLNQVFCLKCSINNINFSL